MNERGDEDKNDREKDRSQDVIDPMIPPIVSRRDGRSLTFLSRGSDRFVSDANV